GGVEEDAAGLHRGGGVGVDHVVRVLRGGGGAGAPVGVPQHGVEVGHGFHAAIAQLFGRHVLVVANDAHAEGACRFGHTAADIAHTDDAEGLAVHLEQALPAVLAPVGQARAPVHHHRLLGQCEHEHDGVLGHGV